ncbi:hypothetical protein ACFE04_009309 [Oxalis oulophora]
MAKSEKRPSSLYTTGKRVPRSVRQRAQKREKANRKASFDKTQFQKALSKLPPRFTNEELCNVMALQNDPFVCLALFDWATHQHRFRHDNATYHVVIKKLGNAKLYDEMDEVVNQVLALRHIGNEALYNTMIYFFTENRKLVRAVNVFTHMRNSRNLECKPSIRTYNILLTALSSTKNNYYINQMYMENISCLFKQLVNDGIEPDLFSLNTMIKGYVQCLHVEDALRIFHQMDTVYHCAPNSFSYDYLIHGLCCHGRTRNARELCDEMKEKGFTPSDKSYNSIVNSLAINGEIEEAVKYLREMIEKQRLGDFITYKTVLDEICRRGRVEEAIKLLKELKEKDVVNGHDYRKLQFVLEDDYENPDVRSY